MCSNNCAQSKLFLFFIVGACDGMTYEEIEEEYPEEFEMREKDKLAYRYPRFVISGAILVFLLRSVFQGM